MNDSTNCIKVSILALKWTTYYLIGHMKKSLKKSLILLCVILLRQHNFLFQVLRSIHPFGGWVGKETEREGGGDGITKCVCKPLSMHKTPSQWLKISTITWLMVQACVQSCVLQLLQSSEISFMVLNTLIVTRCH